MVMMGFLAGVLMGAAVLALAWWLWREDGDDASGRTASPRPRPPSGPHGAGLARRGAERECEAVRRRAAQLKFEQDVAALLAARAMQEAACRFRGR